jgi:hypothetical protein
MSTLFVLRMVLQLLAMNLQVEYNETLIKEWERAIPSAENCRDYAANRRSE